tara:strand:- start:465 stop:1124 length:660 start_codon:yes stop_codon:yes gene_type:complete
MSQKNNINVLWPTFIGEFYNPEHKEIKSNLLNYFDNYMKKNPSNRSGENFNLYESKYDLHTQDNKDFKKLLKFIADSFLAMSNEINKIEVKKLNNPNFQVNILDSWFINYKKGGHVLPHAHGNCSWCCVYYVQIGKDADSTNGATYFQKPTPIRTQNDFGSLYNKSLILSSKPHEGKLIVWPNYLMHGSYPYTGEKNRVIVSANALISLTQDNKPIISI